MKKRLILMSLLLLIIVGSHAYAMDLGGVRIHGFLSQGYLLTDENNYLAESEDGSFQFNELGINFSKDLTDNLRIGLQIFARDLGTVGNSDIEIDWGYGDYRFQDWLGIRVGLMKMSHGLYNETRDVDMLRTFILLPQGVYNETTRDYYTRMWGGEIYGEIPLSRLGSLSYRALTGTYSPDAKNSGLSKYIEDEGPFDVTSFENGVQYNVGLQWYTPVEGLRLGVTHWRQADFTAKVENSVSLGPGIPSGLSWDVEFENRTTVYSIEYSWMDLVVFAEYRFRETSVEARQVSPRDEWDSDAYYAGATFRFTEWFELGTYYSESYPRKNDKNGNRFITNGQPGFRAWQKDFALTTRFDFNEYWIFKLEGHVINGTGDLFLLDNPDGFKEDWYLFTAKITFSF